ncbi:MAG: DNA replication complex GINS family protein [Nanoarchaeota archaeon]|nr:DNA replication complex GINS family protein [Nanoarchaeota archaeon]
MAQNIITYETLYEILRRERTRQELQELEPDFFKNTVKYIKEKAAILESQKEKSPLFQEEVKKTQKQIENIKKILKELYERRELKIINLALSSSRTNTNNPSNLLHEELILYNNIKNLLDVSRENILNKLIKGEIPINKESKPIKSHENELKLIRFIKHVPKFVGTDNYIYGPFEPEMLANLPSKIADLLIKKERAEQI